MLLTIVGVVHLVLVAHVGDHMHTPRAPDASHSANERRGSGMVLRLIY